MPRRGILARRSTGEWSVRGALAFTAALLGYFSVAHTLGSALRTSDPARAHALAPANGRIAASLAQELADAEATAADRARADRLAREALLRDPTAVAAVSTLLINAQLRGNTQQARRLFGYAQRLSRRDLQAQLWAIEDAVARGDVPGALRHYDIALRTSRGAPDLLFPILASATAEASVRAALARTLAAKPAWGNDFIQYIAGRGPDPLATAQLFLALRRAGLALSPGARTGLVNLLVERGHIDEAWSYYASIRPEADRRRSRDPLFVISGEQPSAFDWISTGDSSISLSIQQNESGGVLDFSAPTSVGGPMLQQLQLLPPGDYRIEGHSIGIDQPEGASPYWVLSCRGGRELGRVVVPNSAQANGTFAGRLSVPVGCPVQMLTLVARPSDAVSGLSGQIDRVLLSPAT